jgi:hypothetical protein
MAKLIPEMFVPAGPALSGGPLLADRLLPADAAPPAPPPVAPPVAPPSPTADFWAGPALVDGRRATRREAARALMAGGLGLPQAVAAILAAAFAAPPEGAKGDLDPEGRWVTISGNKIHIDSEGQIEAGGHPELRKILAEKAGLVAKGDAPEPAKPEPVPEPPAKHKLKKNDKGDYDYRDHNIYRVDWHSNAYKPWHINPPSKQYGKQFDTLEAAKKENCPLFLQVI